MHFAEEIVTHNVGLFGRLDVGAQGNHSEPLEDKENEVDEQEEPEPEQAVEQLQEGGMSWTWIIILAMCIVPILCKITNNKEAETQLVDGQQPQAQQEHVPPMTIGPHQREWRRLSEMNWITLPQTSGTKSSRKGRGHFWTPKTGQRRWILCR